MLEELIPMVCARGACDFFGYVYTAAGSETPSLGRQTFASGAWDSTRKIVWPLLHWRRLIAIGVGPKGPNGAELGWLAWATSLVQQCPHLFLCTSSSPAGRSLPTQVKKLAPSCNVDIPREAWIVVQAPEDLPVEFYEITRITFDLSQI